MHPPALYEARQQFPALLRQVNERTAVFLDGPAGTQVPQSVIDAITNYYVQHNANHGGAFVTSHESDDILRATHQAIADLLGASDSDCVAFGANMTSLTFALSRALGQTWQSGDEIIVSRLDHDANVRPWVLAAQDAGAQVHFVEIHREDCTLDLDDLKSKLNERTRLVALGCASNSVGTINPYRDVIAWAHEVGALVFLDAVHYAPHALIDVESWDCDFLACSAYKFFGPHVGILWGKRKHLQSLTAYKLKTVPDSLPDKWMTGTQNHECLAGTLAAVNYLADIGRNCAEDQSLPRRSALETAFNSIQPYEQFLVERLLAGLRNIPGIQIWGINDPARAHERLPTLSITHHRLSPEALATELGQRGLFVWHGNYYALELTESLGLEPDGMVRIGLVHYNTADEVDRLLGELEQLA
ncbi:MAG: cysteine desulfurase-like protein [Pirellulales bacterium]|nr:cysteine desulfurase-like protein [Pirellulales bacterium]